MHEASLVKSLMGQVAAVLAEHRGAGVSEIRVEIGPLSGVEPALVHSAFERLAPASPARGARLIIDEVPLTVRCRTCETQFAIEDFNFCCPECGSTNLVELRGHEFRLLEVTIEQPEPAGQVTQ